ncbi:BREX-1 system adenine-specific DNA-methyltransferase PglX [Arthrobacter sp. D1-29]
METAPLKSFATWARTALIREVSARISVVLASQELRLEQPNAVAALEKAVNAAGGGDKGRDVVADKVAYTWFNRIIALRFMDANGYTGIGVVSPERGREGGQPEVLAEAKRGNIDSAVVTNKRTAETVTSLLNGMRRSDDPQGEAYALLLAEYCRHWNRSMPFMFEREGDYTELLIPANLLADDSVMARAVHVLTEDVCQDVEVIGWLYQFYILERKEEVFAGFKKSTKAGAAEIPAATQLFTPHWIVRYLVENSLGNLWLLNRPTSGLADQMDYYIAPVEETDYLKISSPEELKIIDPACGSGHMLTYAFDLLYAIYEEEGYAPSDIPGLILANNLYGTEIDPRAGALAAFALTMKARACQRTFFSKQVQPNICVLQALSFTPSELETLAIPREGEEVFWNQFQYADTFGSLIRPQEDLLNQMCAHIGIKDLGDQDLWMRDLMERAQRVVHQAQYLSKRYHVVVANPPYMGSKNMSAGLSDWIRAEYPDVKSDLFSAFFYRCLDLVLEQGQLGFMSPFVWMFISSYEKLRRRFVQDQTITSLIQLEYSGFEGATVPVCAFTLEKGNKEYRAAFVRLSDFVGSAQQAPRALEIIKAGIANERGVTSDTSTMSRYFYRATAKDFNSSPACSIVYWLSDDAKKLLQSARTVGDVFEVKAGISTGENEKSFRHWHEVSLSRTSLSGTKTSEWYPHNKGGAFRKWYGNLQYVLRYSPAAIADMRTRPGFRHDGREYYFRPHVGWSQITSIDSSFRMYPAGMTFGSGGLGIFHADESALLKVLAYLNSPIARELIGALNPTLNVSPGALASLPLPELGEVDLELVSQLVDSQRALWDANESSWNFQTYELVRARRSDSPLKDVAVEAVEERSRLLLKVSKLENDLFASSGFGFAEPVANPGSGVRESSDTTVLQTMRDLVSYAVGCMFGRYSIDEPGLILVNQGETLQDYLARVPVSTFLPDKDNVIPVVDGDWFEDDIVERFRHFLRLGFGDEHFEDNLRFVEDTLGKDIRKYFVQDFYKDHVQRYKKRPIYWMFSSAKGSFSALIYMHRYTPSTVSTVLNEYLREFKAKLDASRQHHERLAAGTGAPRQQAAAQKEVDRLRKVMLELDEYEHDVLYPLATQQVQIDLDDGVKANYPKLGAALKKIPGLEASDE